ncbi:MAG: hypothetical protein AAGD96_20665 [Chloroflexota bacterium]
MAKAPVCFTIVFMKNVDFGSIASLLTHLERSNDLTNAVFQGLDLTQIVDQLEGAILKNNVLLGCKCNPEVMALLEEPLVFPRLPDLPFDPYRGTLYTAEELLGDYRPGEPESYYETVDGQTYKQFVKQGKAEAMDIMVTLARRLHDHAITDALQEFLIGKQVVAIMGGHSMLRDDPTYLEVARMARDLANAGFLPTSGGGPGAMEATHLGAWFAERPDAELVDAVSILAKAPLYKPTDKWLDTTFEVKEKYPLTSEKACMSLGIPTWLYGHEPPTAFATHIAKYFANSVREDGLLAIAKNGVIFFPGSAGTIQEIFQDATQNHYEIFGYPSPMIFFNVDFWTNKKPVYPLLYQLAAGKSYQKFLSITDNRSKVIAELRSFYLNNQ